MEWHRHGYRASTDPALRDREAIWSYLRTSYWATGVPRAAIERSFENHLADARIVLGTADAHGLYERFGFRAVDATRMMDRRADRTRAAAPARSASV